MLTILLTILACDRDRTVAFPEGLEPLSAENTATWPDDLAEALDTTSGSDDGTVWAHARGYVHADLDAVYPCLRETDVNLDRRQESTWDRIEDVEDGYEHSYRYDIVVDSLVEVAFSDTWRHGSTLGDGGVPLLTVTAWQMTENNPYMDAKRGSIVSEQVEEGIVSLDIIYEMEVALEDQEQMTTYLSDTHTEVVACTRGEALPTYD